MARDLLLTRRRILQRAGWVVSAAAFPSLVGSGWRRIMSLEEAAPAQAPDAAHPIGEVMAKLSTYMSQARDRPLPDHVLEQAKWHVLDTIAASVSSTCHLVCSSTWSVSARSRAWLM